MKKTFLFILVLFSALSPKICSAQQTIGLFTKTQGSTDGYVLFSPESSYYTYLIDKCGKLVHIWNINAFPALHNYLMPNGDLLTTGQAYNPNFNSTGSAGGILQLYDWNGNLKWKYIISDSRVTQNHDIYPLSNGNILVDEWERFTPAEAVAAGRDSAAQGNLDLWMLKVQEIKPIGTDSAQVVWEWRLWDHIIQDRDSKKPNYGVVADHPELVNINFIDPSVFSFGPLVLDWIHANAVTYNPGLDQIMVSSRSFSEIWIIDRSTSILQAKSHSGGKHNKGGDLLYRWGNPAAYNRGTSKNRRLFVQHNPSWIPVGYPGAGNITVFNNGDGRSSGNYSSADIIVPPVNSNGDYTLPTGKSYGPDSASWSYQAPNPKDFYSPTQGGVQRMSNGNTLICEAEKGNLFEIDTNKNIVWKYVNPDGGYGPETQGNIPKFPITFRATYYSEDYSAFNNRILKPGNPIEQNPLPNTLNCFMPYNNPLNTVYKISQIKGINAKTGVADSLNKGKGAIKGIVESVDLGGVNKRYSIFDNTGDISIAAPASSQYVPKLGDSIWVSGSVIQVNGLTEYNSDTVIYRSNSIFTKKPVVVTKLNESLESGLVALKNMKLVNKFEWSPVGRSFIVHITNGFDTFLMVINNKTDLYKMGPPTELFNLTGIVIQNQPTQPFFGAYEIEPRGSFDIQKITQLYTIKQVRGQNLATGIADSASSRNSFYLKGIVQSPNMVSLGLNFSMKDATGSIIVSASTIVDNYKPTVGDSIVLRGKITQVDGLTEVEADSISILKNAAPIIKSTLISSLSENYEAQLIKLYGYHLVDKSQWHPVINAFDVKITNGIDTFLMRISSVTDLYKMKALVGPYNITGIEIQLQPNVPYLGNYAIEPRGSFDVQRVVQLYSIRQVKTQNVITGVADSAGSKNSFYLKGIVQSPSFTKSGYNFSIKDNTGSIFIISSSIIGNYSPTIGDSILIRGVLVQANGVTEVRIDSLSKLKPASVVLSPRIVAVLSETTEASLVKYTNAKVLNPAQWKPVGNGFTVDISNGIDTIQLYISNATSAYTLNPPSGKFNVVGIGTQNKSGSPFIGSYQLMPRSFSDLQQPFINLYKIKDINGYNSASGIADSVNTYCYLKGVVLSGNLSGRTSESFALQDNTGAITITSSNVVSGYIPVIGDSIKVRGTVLQLRGLTHFTVDSVSKLSSGLKVLPITVTSINENSESKLVTLSGYKLVDPTKWDTTGFASVGSFKILASYGVDTLTLSIVNGTDLFLNSAKPSGEFDVTGIVNQNDLTIPYFSGYYLIPRGQFDIKPFSSIDPEEKLAEHFQIYPNPTNGSLKINASFNITNLQITDIVGHLIICQKPYDRMVQLDVNSLQEGVYFVKVFNGASFITQKIIKNSR